LRAAADQFGRRVVAIDVDEHGMVPDALAKACRNPRVRMAYLNPTLQNPTGATMPEQRRRDLASTAVRCRVRIVEDDPYWLFAQAAPRPLAHFAPDHAYYVSTLSKCLTPGLRIAFVLLPVADERERFLTALRAFALMAAPLTTALATQWIFDGSANNLLNGVREEAQARHNLAQEILAGRPNAGGEGLHVWLTLPSYWSSSELARAAAGEGLAVTPAEVFCVAPAAPNAIRISLGSIKERKRLASGLRRLSQLLARRPASFNKPVI
jgi:DNA-binding transcriptional MocR family regulator